MAVAKATNDTTLRRSGLVSVIVTTRNSARTLEACLASIERQTYHDIEIVVVDNSSTDATPDIAQRFCDVFATKGPERSAQRNLGAELSQGEYLVFIDSDMVLETGVVSDGVGAIAEGRARGVMIPEMSFGDGFWTRCRILERQCYLGDDDVEAARMYRHTDFVEVGGFDLELNGPEDWDLSRRLAGPDPFPRTASIIHHDEGRTSLRGSFVKRRYYAPGYLHYLKKHRRDALAQGNAVLRPAFLRHWRDLLRHPILTSGMFTLKIVELLAVVQVAAEQGIFGRAPDRARQVYQHRSDTADQGACDGVGPGGPLMVTFGSVEQPHGGVQTRARLTAEVFTDLGVPMTIVSTREPARREAPAWAAALTAPRNKPAKGFSVEFARLIHREAASCSVVIANNAMFLPAITAARVRQPLIWDTNECQTLHYRRLPPTVGNRLKYLAWLGLERWAARRCRLAIAIGDEEAAIWRSTHPCLRDKLVIVDHATLATGRDQQKARKKLSDELGRPLIGPVLLFLGTLRAKHNAAAAHWILDELVGTLSPDVTVVLCGPGSDELVTDAGEVHRAGDRRGTEKGAAVFGLGAVDDVDAVVAASDLCLAPLAAGAGVKTKVLHYLAHGKRVVGTPTAFEGVADAPGLYPTSLEDLPALVAQLCGTVESPTAAGERARAQQAWMDEHHGRTRIAEQWKQVLARFPTPQPTAEPPTIGSSS